jgi:hypothetical protein
MERKQLFPFFAVLGQKARNILINRKEVILIQDFLHLQRYTYAFVFLGPIVLVTKLNADQL